METERKNSGQIIWINSLKFFASIFVLWSHYYEGFLYIDAASAINPVVLSILDATRGIVKGDLWVCVFCFISGLFAEKKRIDTLKTLLIESVLRYLRFAIPFFMVGLIIWAVSLCGGFLNPVSNSIIGDNWYFNIFYAEQIDIKTFLLGVLIFDPALNQPAWMMKMMLFGNLLILLASYLKAITGRNEIKIIFFVLILACSFVFNKLYIGSCIVGALFAPILKVKYSTKNRMIMLFSSAIVMAVVFLDIPSALFWKSTEIFGHDYQTVRDFFLAPMIFVFIHSTKYIKKAMSISILEKLSRYSFPIFLIHWPVMSSISLLLYKLLLPVCSYTVTFIVVFILTTLIVVGLAALYGETLNKFTDRLLKTIRERLYSVKMLK